MQVKRIVSNILADDLEAAKAFYRDLLGLEIVMDLGWIVTFQATHDRTFPQISVARDGGGGIPLPDISVEVDDLNEAYARALASGAPITYGAVDEPWGVRRFFVRDPFGRSVNVLAHQDI